MIGRCPFCDDGIIEEKDVKFSGEKGKIFQCSNALWNFENDGFYLKKESKCSYRIFSNCLLKYNKKHLGKQEVKRMLSDGEIEVVLHSRNPFFKKVDGKMIKKHKEYRKKIIPNLEYGIEIIWKDEND